MSELAPKRAWSLGSGKRPVEGSAGWQKGSSSENSTPGSHWGSRITNPPDDFPVEEEMAEIEERGLDDDVVDDEDAGSMDAEVGAIAGVGVDDDERA